MKTLLSFILAAMAFCASAQTVHTFTAAANNGEIYRSSLPGVLPGDTIKLVGINNQADIVYLNGIAGTAANPIIITVDDTLQVGVTRTNYGMWLNGSHFKVLGKRKLIIKPSFDDTLSTGISLNTSNQYSIEDVDIYWCKAGIIQNPETGGMRENITFRNIRFYDLYTTIGGTGEAIYIGSTKLKQLGEHVINDGGTNKTVNAWFNNLLVENCYGYGVDGDFIQLALCQNTIVRNCGVWNYGRLNLSSHKNAYLIGGSSTITLENCTANTGSGPYVQVFGHGQNIIRNCNFSSGATGQVSDDGIYINKTNLDTPALYLSVSNTVINGARRHGINNTEALSVVLCNVSITSTAANTSGSNFSSTNTCIVAPPSPIKPTPTPAKKPKRGRAVRVGG